MGLASYGKPLYFQKIQDNLFLNSNKFFKLNLNYFNHNHMNFNYSHINSNNIPPI